jgi:uncharacterized UPF0146 family protein
MGKTKEIHTSTDNNQLVEMGVRSFTALLQTLKKNGHDTPPEILLSFVAGYVGALRVIGFTVEDVEKIARKLHQTIVEVGTGEMPKGCGECDACKSNEK